MEFPLKRIVFLTITHYTHDAGMLSSPEADISQIVTVGVADSP